MVIELFDQYASKYDAWFRSEQGCVLFPAEAQAIQLLLNQLISHHQRAGFPLKKGGRGLFSAVYYLSQRSVTDGISASGYPLSQIMPRWEISEKGLNDLLEYLKSLGD